LRLSVTALCRAHETWDLPEPPDYVTFAKKFQAAGFFHKAGLRPKQVSDHH